MSVIHDVDATPPWQLVLTSLCLILLPEGLAVALFSSIGIGDKIAKLAADDTMDMAGNGIGLRLCFVDSTSICPGREASRCCCTSHHGIVDHSFLCGNISFEIHRLSVVDQICRQQFSCFKQMLSDWKPLATVITSSQAFIKCPIDSS